MKRIIFAAIAVILVCAVAYGENSAPPTEIIFTVVARTVGTTEAELNTSSAAMLERCQAITKTLTDAGFPAIRTQWQPHTQSIGYADWKKQYDRMVTSKSAVTRERAKDFAQNPRGQSAFCVTFHANIPDDKIAETTLAFFALLRDERILYGSASVLYSRPSAPAKPLRSYP